MRTRVATIGIAAFALLGVTACTPEEIQQAVSFSDARAAAEVEVEVVPTTVQPGTYTVVADCHGATLDMSGWPDGLTISLSLGMQPPVALASHDGVVHTTLARAANDVGEGAEWVLYVTDGDGPMDDVDARGPAVCG